MAGTVLVAMEANGCFFSAFCHIITLSIAFSCRMLHASLAMKFILLVSVLKVG